METPQYVLNVKRPIKLLEILLNYIDDSFYLMLEGDLSQCDMRGISITSGTPIGVFVRNTSESFADFIILSLDADSKEKIKRQLLPRCGLRHRIYHILIGNKDNVLFASYDSFDDALLSGNVNESLLTLLLSSAAIKNYEYITV